MDGEVEGPLLLNEGEDSGGMTMGENGFLNMEDMDDEIEFPLLLNQGEDSGGTHGMLQDELGVESLDYDPIIVCYMPSRRESTDAGGSMGTQVIHLLSGSSLSSLVPLLEWLHIVIESSQEFLITSKKHWTGKTIEQGLGLVLVFLAYAAFGIFLVLLASCLVLFWAPSAAGGGVTLVMAYLNGNDIPDFLRHSTLFTKIFGTICTVSSGLPLGQEGPLVHIGAAIASSLTLMHGHYPLRERSERASGSLQLWWNRLSKFKPRTLPFDFHNDKERREFISAGTAAGLAAAFGAPIGGVLFSLEEASSFWSRKVMWRSLLCTLCAILVLSWLHNREFSLSLPGNISFHGLQQNFDLQDVPLFVVTSAGAGMLGAFLNTAHGWLAQFRPLSGYRLLRLVEACLITFISVAVIFTLPHFFGQCLHIQEGQNDNDYWFRYTCPEVDPATGVGYYNDLATLFFSVPHQTIEQLLAWEKGVVAPFTLRSMGIHSGSFLLLFILAYGIATPGGIFMPSIMAGASFGAFIGRIFECSFPDGNVQPGLHALVGATAMLGGVFRTSISLVVIMVEGTGGIDFMLPVILAIVLSNWVAQYIHPAGAYEADLERLGEIYFLRSEPPKKLFAITAAEVMAPNVICFDEIVAVAEVVKVLHETRHNGFPVIRYTSLDSSPDRQLAGLILRHQLMLLLEQRAFIEVESEALHSPILPRRLPHSQRVTKEQHDLENAMRVYHHSHNPHRRYLSSLPEAIDELELTEVLQESTVANGEDNQSEDGITWPMELALDLRPWMNRAPLTVRAECSAERVYMIFRTLGLRHLCVTNCSNRVIGMITRRDLAQALISLEAADTGKTRETMEAEYSRSFGRSFSVTTTRDVLFSLP